MRRRFFAALALLAAAAFAQTGPAGHWEGSIKPEGREIGLSLDLAQNQKGEWIASMGIPAANSTGLFVKDLAVTGKSVKFMAVEIQMATVELTLAANGKLTGTITNPRGGGPMFAISHSSAVEFQRTGEAKVELMPASPAVSKDLEGDWAGTIKTPGPEFQVEVHFKNQPDNTVRATIDIPATNAMGMPLNNVKQTGDKVEFVIANTSPFQGSMNKEHTELTGQQLGYDKQAMAVALKKK
jgi:hypothetical protein